MQDEFDIKFWERDYKKRFNLDREGEEILHFLVQKNPSDAEQFMKDKYQRTVYKSDIIDEYGEKFNTTEINKLLKDLDFEGLTQEEIEEYGIKVVEEKKKPKCVLLGQDGNIFNLMGIASRTLKRNKMSAAATEMCNRITSEAKSYDEALCIIGEYVEITDGEECEEDEF